MNTESDNKFLREEVKENMKQNKLLDVALQKTEKQKDALREFLRRNNQLDVQKPQFSTDMTASNMIKGQTALEDGDNIND